MNCHRCGNILPTNVNVCPHCYRTPDKTKRLSETDLHKTRLLIHVDRCQNCGFLIYPGDTECTACGTWVDRAWKIPKATRVAKAQAKRKRLMFGVTAGVVASIFLLVLLFIFLKR